MKATGPAAIDETRERKPGHAFRPQTRVPRTGSNAHHEIGRPDPFPGLPADTARAVPVRYKWQPIGNYLAKLFPMWPSVLEGLEELNYHANSHQGDINELGYSHRKRNGSGAVAEEQRRGHQRFHAPSGSTTSNMWCCGATRCGSRASEPTTVTFR